MSLDFLNHIEEERTPSNAWLIETLPSMSEEGGIDFEMNLYDEARNWRGIETSYVGKLFDFETEEAFKEFIDERNPDCLELYASKSTLDILNDWFSEMLIATSEETEVK